MLTAVDPRHAVSFFRDQGWHGFTVLGAVFLVGGESLYADMDRVLIQRAILKAV